MTAPAAVQQILFDALAGQSGGAGQLVDLRQVRCPVFVVAGAEDYIAPALCVKALLDHVGTEDKTYLELPGGHISLIAGRSASRHCWPRVAGWLAERAP